MVPQVELFMFIFLGELKTPKRHFEINRPLQLLLDPIWLKNEYSTIYFMAAADFSQ